MTVSLSMLAGAGAQFFDNNGVPLAGGLLYTYLAGSVTPATTYQTSAGSGGASNSNPIVLDSAGRVPYQIWLTDNTDYKFILKTSGGVTIRTEDNVYGAGDYSEILALLAASSGSSLVGFIQSGTGAVATTVQAKLREVEVSVTDFGAVGDGVTDDTAAIQAALTAADKVRFPIGQYLITDTLLFKSSQTILGDGYGSIIKLQSGLSKNMFKPVGPFGSDVSPNSYSCDDVTFRDLCIDHNITDSGDFVESIMTIVAQSVKRFKCERVHFKNPSGDSIYIAKKYGSTASTVVPYDITIDHCTFSGTNINRNAISVITGYNGKITNNHFYQMTKDNMPCPIDLEPNNTGETIYNWQITGNDFWGCKGGINTYITGTTYSDYSSIRNITISNNNFYNQRALAVFSAESTCAIAVYNASNVIVSDNNIYGTPDVGVILAKSYAVNVTGNNIIECTLGGILVKDVQQSKIDDNLIIVKNGTYSGSACYGIKTSTFGLVAATNYAFVGGSVANNKIKSTAGAPSGSFGVLLRGNTTLLDISGIVSGFNYGLYQERTADLAPTLNSYDLDTTQNTTAYGANYGASVPESLRAFNLGWGVTTGEASFSASTTKVVTSLPVLTTSIVRATRIGTTGLANTLTAQCATNGQITVTSSASESGSFIWEIVKF